MKIVHIFHDDKFPSMAHTVFERIYPGQNEFITFTNKKKLSNNKDINPIIYPRYYILFGFKIKKIINGDVIVFHSMSSDNLKILKFLSKGIKVIWLGWGYDYYDLLPKKLLKEKTNARFGDKFFTDISIKVGIKRVVKKIIYRKLDKFDLINKVDIFSPVLYEDYLLVKKALPNFTAKYKSWNYGTLEDNLVRGFEDKQLTGDNILFGNSSSVTNNHIDALPLLKELNLHDRKVITPLSYGDPTYREAIICAGEESLGAAFRPLVDFMPIDEYIAIVQSCSVVVMNHLRQQALGNIVIALYLGAKVFLDKDNPIYSFFKKLDAHVYSIDELKQEYGSRLDVMQVKKNREILKGYWGRDVILGKTKAIVEAALAS